MERNTSQKQIIKDYLKSVYSHPSADEIYLAVRKKLPRISKSTVYRVLNQFTKQGLIQELIVNNFNHFDAQIFPHAHFICQKCQKIFDMDLPSNFKYHKKTKIGEIKNYQLYFYGLCQKCQAKEKIKS